MRDGTHDTPKYVMNGVPLITSKNLSDGGIDYSNVKYISKEDALAINERSGVDVGDILFAMIGTIGNPAMVKESTCISIKNVALIKFTFSLNLYNKYVMLFLNFAQKSMKNQTQGGLQPFVSLSFLRKYLIPIPPINEQKNISNVADEVFKYVSYIDSTKLEIKDLSDLIKSRILDLAIRGKLVPQDPNDEPADILLERIRKEKDELIKQGKIKRDKKESIIFKGDDNSYYGNLPKNWTLTTLKEITNDKELNDGDWIVSDDMVDSGPVKLIQLGSVGFMNYIEKGFKYLTLDTFKRLNCSTIKENYLLINRIISDKMCCCMLPKIDGTLITTVDTCWISPNNNHYNIKYLMFVLSSPLFQSEVIYKSSGTTRKRISKLSLIDIQFPFPPIEEQNKIVDKVENIFKIIENIANVIK